MRTWRGATEKFTGRADTRAVREATGHEAAYDASGLKTSLRLSAGDADASAEILVVGNQRLIGIALLERPKLDALCCDCHSRVNRGSDRIQGLATVRGSTAPSV